MAYALDHYAAEYDRARGQAALALPAHLTRAREDALARFLSLGFPTVRDEEWRFTPVGPIANERFALAGAPRDRVDVDPFRLGGALAAEIVFVNGRYAPALSALPALPGGASVESLQADAARGGPGVEALATVAPFERQPFTALNTALLHDAACIVVPAHVAVDDPIHILFVTADRDGASMTHPRVLLVLGDDSRATVVETYAGARGAYWTNAVTEAVVGQNAVLDHYKLQRESVNSSHVAAMHVRAARGANVSSHSLGLGGSLVRNDVVAVLDGEGVACTLNGLYVVDGERLIDNHTTIDHAKPHCGSREVYKGILAERSRGVFNGKIIVRPDAQKTDAKQTNRALLLSEDARINTKPQLEIFANDVKCTHGAAVGQLDAEAIFYLRARGLSEADARRLLIHAFAGDVLDRMPLARVRAAADALLRRQLAPARAAA